MEIWFGVGKQVFLFLNSLEIAEPILIHAL